MRISSVANLLSGQLPALQYSAEISEELAAHRRALAKRGASAPVMVAEDMDMMLDRSGLSTLCRLFAAGQLSAAELAYIADALQLSERVAFSDPSVAGDLAECTDPEIHGPLSVERALEIARNGAAV